MGTPDPNMLSPDSAGAWSSHCITEPIDAPGTPGYLLAKTPQEDPSGDLVKMSDGNAVPNLPDGSKYPVYIYFQPPTATMPGFNVPANLNIKQLSQ